MFSDGHWDPEACFQSQVERRKTCFEWLSQRWFSACFGALDHLHWLAHRSGWWRSEDSDILLYSCSKEKSKARALMVNGCWILGRKESPAAWSGVYCLLDSIS